MILLLYVGKSGDVVLAHEMLLNDKSWRHCVCCFYHCVYCYVEVFLSLCLLLCGSVFIIVFTAISLCLLFLNDFTAQ